MKSENWELLGRGGMDNLIVGLHVMKSNGPRTEPWEHHTMKYTRYQSINQSIFISTTNKYKTRKLCYRKDDRAMRPIHGPLKFSGLPDYSHGYYSQRFSWAFVLIHLTNVPSKFEIRSFTRSWDKRGWLSCKLYYVYCSESSRRLVSRISMQHAKRVSR